MGESISKTLKKINTDLKGKPFISILFTLLILTSYLGFKIFTSNEIFSAKAFTYKASNITSKDLRSKDSVRYIYASKRGKRYYFYNCKSTIKEANKIYFDSVEEAEKAGYTLAKACQ